MYALILEDNADRRQAMTKVLADMLPVLNVEFFVKAKDIINRIENSSLFDVAFIALDNDLDMIQTPEGRFLDAGDGIEVSRFLANNPPITPVIVHTTNTAAGDQIVEQLVQNDWDVARVVPYNDLQWISEAWRSVVRDRLVRRTSGKSLSTFGVRIIRNFLRTRNFELCIRELLRAIVYAACDRIDCDDLCLELTVSTHHSAFHSSLKNVDALLNHPALRRRVVDVARDNCRTSPIILAASDSAFEPDLQDLFVERNVSQIRLDFCEPLPNLSTVLMTLSCSPEVDLWGLTLDDIIIEGRALIDLALLSMHQYFPDQPLVYSEARTSTILPTTVQETQE